jgi:methionine sulfoxide reductase heme-binding subunit
MLLANAGWYVARAGGLTAFVLLTASVVLGLLLSGRASVGWPRFALQDVHRFAGILAGTFVAVHGLALLVDDYFSFSLASLIVPGAAPYRPVAVAAGVVAAELLVALAVTNRYQKAIPYSYWRRAHYLNFAVWLLALVHGLAAGTDSDTTWALAVYSSAVAAVAGLTAWRFLRVRRIAVWALGLWSGAAAVLGVELVVALALGPLQQ